MQTNTKLAKFNSYVVKYSLGLNETAHLHTQGGAAIHVELMSGEQKGKQVQASCYPAIVSILQRKLC